jgi:YesN/AraC family two-component response regulator
MPLTIVVADDDPQYREIVRYIVATVPDAMTIVAEAGDGEEALALVRRERPDIVITDLVMPLLDGIQLTRRIRQELPRTKVILHELLH